MQEVTWFGFASAELAGEETRVLARLGGVARAVLRVPRTSSLSPMEHVTMLLVSVRVDAVKPRRRSSVVAAGRRRRCALRPRRASRVKEADAELIKIPDQRRQP